jgi:hypothetical protein
MDTTKINKCDVVRCTHNVKGGCRVEIEVDNRGICTTFAEDTAGAVSKKAKGNVTSCQTMDCLFNHFPRCSSPAINVLDEDGGAYCEAYKIGI